MSDTPIPFILFGLASLALVALVGKLASGRVTGQPGSGAMAALLLLTLLMGLLLQQAPRAGFFFVVYFLFSAIFFLPAVGVLIHSGSKLSEVQQAMGAVVLVLVFVYPWLAFAVAPHPVLSC